MKIGVVGYINNNKFNKNEAIDLIQKVFNELDHKFKDIKLVSGLSYTGIPGIAYEVADDLGWNLIGIAPYEVFNYQLYDVDKYFIVGKFFGDESDVFLKNIDMLITFGGGNQTKDEVKKFQERYPNKFCYEFKL